jgi:hypothetical protein
VVNGNHWLLIAFKIYSFHHRSYIRCVITLPLKQMSRSEKLMALEALWEELSRDETELESPAWHQEELAATEHRVKEGKEQFVDWENAKKQLRQ